MTLFPFLSVLAGLIAVLMLFLIGSVSTRVFDTLQSRAVSDARVAVDESVDAESYEELQRRLEQLRAQVQNRIAHQQQLAREQQHLSALLEAKKNELGEMAPRKRTRVERTKLGELEPVVMAQLSSGGASVREKPVFIEVSAAGFVAHPDDKVIPATADADGEVAIPSALSAIIADVHRRKETHYLVLLIHPNGAAAFRAVLAHVGDHHGDMNVGWEPFSREWVLKAKNGD